MLLLVYKELKFILYLENVSVVKVLHSLSAQIGTQVLEAAGRGVLEAEHVEDAHEAVSDVPHGVVERRHGARARTPSRASSGPASRRRGAARGSVLVHLQCD